MHKFEDNTVAEAKRENRARFPQTAALVDALVAAGMAPKIKYVSENGVSAGRKPKLEGYVSPRSDLFSRAEHPPTAWK